MTALKLPFTLDGVTYNDGDFINISTPQPEPARTVTTESGFFLPYDPPAYGSLGNLFIGAAGTPYKFDPNIKSKSFTYPDYQVVNSNANIEQVFRTVTWDPVTGTKAIDNRFVGNELMSDAYLSPKQMLYVQRMKSFYDTDVNDAAVQPTKFDRMVPQANLPTNQNYSADLILEFHADNFVSFRASNGKYLHALPIDSVSDTTYSAPRQSPSDLVATFSSLPSQQPSAQWTLIKSDSSSQLALQNRASGTYLVLTGGFTLAYTRLFAQIIGPFNYASRPSNYRNNPMIQTTQWYEYYGQPYYRLTASSATPVSSFTFSRPTQYCDPRTNPANSVCLAKSELTSVTDLQRVCGTGDMPTTPQCRSWLIDNPTQSNVIVDSYCAANPNDLTFCGCTNLWPFRGIIDFISLGTQKVGFQALCNSKTCATNRTTCWHPKNEPSCVSQVCIQGLTLNSAVNSNVSFNPNCNATEGETTNTNDLEQLYDKYKEYLTPLYGIILLLITAILYFVLRLIGFGSIPVAFTAALTALYIYIGRKEN